MEQVYAHLRESLPIAEWCNSRCAIALELKH